jgi:hypothetical protein
MPSIDSTPRIPPRPHQGRPRDGFPMLALVLLGIAFWAAAIIGALRVFG